MEIRLKYIFKYSSPNDIVKAERLEAFDKVLRESRLGFFDARSSEIVFDDKDMDKVMTLINQYLLISLNPNNNT